MSPLGKLTLALIGARFFGLNGLLIGLFFGHMLVDKTFIIRKIERMLSHADDVIRLKLPYKYYRYYNRLDGNIWGKIWGAVLGALLFGLPGFILLFIVGQIVFDMPQNMDIRRVKKDTDHFFDNHWGAIFGLILGIVLKSPLIVCVGVVVGFVADYQRLEGAKLIPFKALSGYWQKINPLKLWRNAIGGEHRRYLETMAALSALLAEADGKVSPKEKETFAKVFAVKPKQKSLVADIFNTPRRHLRSVEVYAGRLEELTRFNDDLKESSLENLFKIAAANVKVSSKQLKMLEQVAQIINLDEDVFAKLKKIFMPRPIGKKLAHCYEVLGLPQDADMAEIKAKWKKLIVIYHPDKLANASAEEKDKATAKMAEINLAYQEIVKAKGKE